MAVSRTRQAHGTLITRQPMLRKRHQLRGAQPTAVRPIDADLPGIAGPVTTGAERTFGAWWPWRLAARGNYDFVVGTIDRRYALSDRESQSGVDREVANVVVAHS